MQLFLLLLLLLATALHLPAAGRKLRISILLPELRHGVRMMSLEQVRPVVDVAVAKMLRRGLLPPQQPLLVAKNSECDYSVAPVLGLLLLKDTDLLLGPYCSYCLAAVARYNRYHLYRRPIVTTGGSASQLENKREYYNLIRVGPNLQQAERMLHEIFVAYGWRPRRIQNLLLIGTVPEADMGQQAASETSIAQMNLLCISIEESFSKQHGYIVRRLQYDTRNPHLQRQVFRVMRNEVRRKLHG